MSDNYHPPQGKGTKPLGLISGIGVSALLFLAIPLTQIFNTYEKQTTEINAIEVAPPAPPPPEEEPPPPEPEPEEEPPPELEVTPPPLTLEQLDLALNPGTGGSLAGDFALPSFNIQGSDLGGLEIFDLGDVDTPPTPRTAIEFILPSAAKRRGVKGIVKVEYIVNENGRTEQIKIVESPDKLLSRATTDALTRARFEPAQVNGKTVKVRMRAAIPYK